MPTFLIRKLSLLLDPNAITMLDSEGRKAFVYRASRPVNLYFILWVSWVISSTGGLRHSSLVFDIGVLFVGYLGLSGILNKTIVEIANRTLFVKHGPIPYPRNRAIPVENVISAYCEKIEGKPGRFTHNLRVIISNGKGVTLLGGLHEESIAQSIVIQLKKWIHETKEHE
jgi:hypothetical protein